MKEKKVKIKIFAVVARGEGADAERENIRITGDGVMRVSGSRIEIQYEEILGENGPSLNTISFETDDCGVVTLVREGDAVCAVMTFSEKARFSGSYDTGFAAFDFTVAARRVSNTVTFERGGVILLDYSTEIQGVAVQTSRFRFDIVCDGEAHEKCVGKVKKIKKFQNTLDKEVKDMIE